MNRISVVLTLMAIAAAALAAGKPDPFPACSEGYRQLQAKQYEAAIEHVEKCIAMPSLQAKPNLAARAHYLYAVALYFSGRYNDAGHELAVLDVEYRKNLDSTLNTYLDTLRETLEVRSSKVSTQFDPSLSDKRQQGSKDLAKKAEQRRQEQEAGATSNTAEPNLNSVIENAPEVLGMGTEAAQLRMRDTFDPPYELRSGIDTSTLQPVLPSDTWK